MEVFQDSETDVPLEDCGGGVALTETFTSQAKVTTFTDNAGNVRRVDIHVDFNGVIANSGSGNTYRDPEHSNRVIDVDGNLTIHGLVCQVHVPGQGSVIHDTGTIVFDPAGNITFVAGPHMVAEGTAPDPCDVLV